MPGSPPSFSSFPCSIKDLFLDFKPSFLWLLTFPWPSPIQKQNTKQKLYCHPTFPSRKWYHIPFSTRYHFSIKQRVLYACFFHLFIIRFSAFFNHLFQSSCYFPLLDWNYSLKDQLWPSKFQIKYIVLNSHLFQPLFTIGHHWQSVYYPTFSFFCNLLNDFPQGSLLHIFYISSPSWPVLSIPYALINISMLMTPKSLSPNR